MIRRLDLLDLGEVTALLRVQRLAYSVEADLIGFYDIPPLKDNIQTLQSCSEAFYGYFRDDDLYGVISYTRHVDDIDICRLVVHPNMFRQGVGAALLEHVLATESDAKRFTVSTGQKNIPAIKLYKKYGFAETGATEVNSGIFVIHFQKETI